MSPGFHLEKFDPSGGKERRGGGANMYLCALKCAPNRIVCLLSHTFSSRLPQGRGGEGCSGVGCGVWGVGCGENVHRKREILSC